MQDEFQEKQANAVSALFQFLGEHYKDIRPVLMLICNRAENGNIAKLFPRGIVATRLKPAVPKIRELIEKIDELLQ